MISKFHYMYSNDIFLFYEMPPFYPILFLGLGTIKETAREAQDESRAPSMTHEMPRLTPAVPTPLGPSPGNPSPRSQGAEVPTPRPLSAGARPQVKLEASTLRSIDTGSGSVDDYDILLMYDIVY